MVHQFDKIKIIKIINIKLSNTQLQKIRQSGEFLGRILWPLLKTVLFLMENVLKPLAKSFLIPSGLTGIYKKTFRSVTTTVFSNEDLNDIMKKIKSLKESGLLKVLQKQSKMKQMRKRMDFLEYYWAL